MTFRACEIIIKLMVTLSCLQFTSGISFGVKKLEPCPDCSSLEVTFKIF